MSGIPDCSDCEYYDNSPMEDPCYHCLDGYIGRPNFKRKITVRRKEPEKKMDIPKSADEPLPWTED